jgi:hypothetical protein
MMISVRTFEYFLAGCELGLSVLLAYLGARSFISAYVTADPRPGNVSSMEDPAWAALAFVFIVPLCAALTFSGISMLRRSRLRWWYQVAPLLVIFVLRVCLS